MLKESTEAEYEEAFTKYSKNGKLGGRDLEMYLKGVKGIQVLCTIMKCLVHTGVTPHLITTKIIDAIDVDDDRKTEVRREARRGA